MPRGVRLCYKWRLFPPPLRRIPERPVKTRYTALRGTRDILPDEVERWQFLERTAREVFTLYGFDEIRTPIFESTELFARSVGPHLDIGPRPAQPVGDLGGAPAFAVEQ